MEEKRTNTPPKSLGAYIWGIAFIATGTVIMLHRLFFISLKQLFPISLMAVGIILVLTSLYNRKKTKS
jgi:tetrahydromethanopterin S-methyltransferase subunit E